MTGDTHIQPNPSGEPSQAQVFNLASTICCFEDAELREELEKFRVSYERASGVTTDLTRRYTCTWPTEQQHWLLEKHQARVFEGWSSFVRACYTAKMSNARRCGRLDDMPGRMLALYGHG